MNPLLQQLLSLGPGIGSMIGGNGPAAKAFMDSYQQTLAHLEQQKRLKLQDQFAQEDRRTAAEDRQRLIARQNAADTEHQADRVRLGQVYQQQDLGRLSQAANEMTQQAASLGDPMQAKSYIESMMPNLMSVYGQNAMALGQPAVEQAQQLITGRQKKQVEDFLGKWEKSETAAQVKDTDPLLTALPDHIAKMIGKPEARLSELQKFAQLPVGMPARKTRTPAGAGSFEDYVQRKYGDAPTPDQILEARKVYQQVDDRPRVDVNINGGLNPNQEANFTEKLGKDWNAAVAPTREVNRQFSLMETGLKRFRAGDKNGGSQAVLVTFQKILDPSSVVRESEYARSSEGISLIGRLQGYADKLQSGGAGVPEQDLKQMVETARQLKDAVAQNATQQRLRIEALAKKYKIAPELIFGAEPSASGGQIIVTAPDGSKHPFDTQAQADTFKRLAGIK